MERLTNSLAKLWQCRLYQGIERWSFYGVSNRKLTEQNTPVLESDACRLMPVCK